MSIPVIINNRNLLTWPKAMVERIDKYDDVGDVIIVDNESTYQPLLDWYDTNPCKIHRTTNLGHESPWLSGVVKSLNSEYYVVTDSDLGLEDTPDDTLLYLLDKLVSLNLTKVGLGLNWEIVNEKSLYYEHMQVHERNRWRNSMMKEDVALGVYTDTTFSIYRVADYHIGGGSTMCPYVARHYPWEYTQEQYNSDEEFKYYIKHASQSSSYKSFLNL